MFKDDIDLVKYAVEKYGLMTPCADLGGLNEGVTIADYSITLETGDQMARYLNFGHPPFSNILGEYSIINPDKGDPLIENIPDRDKWGTCVCVSVLEHVTNPFDVVDNIYRILKPGGLLVLSTLFSFPLHESLPEFHDNFRFSPNGLKILAEHAELKVLECDFRLKIYGEDGIKDIKNGHAQEIMSVGLIARK
jgi:SAM-dependent methyltransferase